MHDHIYDSPTLEPTPGEGKGLRPSAPPPLWSCRPVAL